MSDVIGDVIHGGEIVVRQRVDSMYRYLPAATRQAREAEIVAEARRLYPWAPAKTVAAVEHARDHCHYLTVRLAVPDRVRAEAVRERLTAAEDTRCACGDYGDWDHSVSGTSRDVPCVWAGCPNCRRGQAIGRPILAADLAWYRRHAPKS